MSRLLLALLLLILCNGTALSQDFNQITDDGAYTPAGYPNMVFTPSHFNERINISAPVIFSLHIALFFLSMSFYSY